MSSASDWVGFHLVSSWNSLWSTSLSSSPSSWHKVNKKRAAKNLCHISGFLYSPLHPGLLLMKLKIKWISDRELLTTLILLPHPATALVSLEKDSPPVLPPLACLSGCQIWLDKRVVLGNLECSCLHPRLPMLPKHFQVITNHVISSAALQLSSTPFQTYLLFLNICSTMRRALQWILPYLNIGTPLQYLDFSSSPTLWVTLDGYQAQDLPSHPWNISTTWDCDLWVQLRVLEVLDTMLPGSILESLITGIKTSKGKASSAILIQLEV